MKNEMYKIRNLLLCNPSAVEDYTESENGELVVVLRNNTSFIISFNKDSGYYIKVYNHYSFNRTKEVYRGFLSIEPALYKIAYYKTKSAEEKWFDLLRVESI